MKKIILFLFILLPTHLVYSQNNQYEVVLTGGNEQHIISAINNDLIKNYGTIKICGTINIENFIEIPEGITLEFSKHGFFDIIGDTQVTINGTVKAEPVQIFSKKNVSGKLLHTEKIYPQWWKSSDEQFWNSTFSYVVQTFKRIYLPSRTYNITSASEQRPIFKCINKDEEEGFLIEGEDVNSTIIKQAIGDFMPTIFLFKSEYDYSDPSSTKTYYKQTKTTVKNITIEGGTGIKGEAAISLSSLWYSKFENIKIKNWRGPAIEFKSYETDDDQDCSIQVEFNNVDIQDIYDSYIDNNGKAGYGILAEETRSSLITINNCNFQNISGNAIKMGGININIRNSRFGQCGTNGNGGAITIIKLPNCDTSKAKAVNRSVSLKNLIIEDTYRYAIHIEQCYGFNLEGLSIHPYYGYREGKAKVNEILDSVNTYSLIKFGTGAETSGGKVNGIYIAPWGKLEHRDTRLYSKVFEIGTYATDINIEGVVDMNPQPSSESKLVHTINIPEQYLRKDLVFQAPHAIRYIDANENNKAVFMINSEKTATEIHSMGGNGIIFKDHTNTEKASLKVNSENQTIFNISNLPTSPIGLKAGDLYQINGQLMVVQ